MLGVHPFLSAHGSRHQKRRGRFRIGRSWRNSRRRDYLYVRRGLGFVVKLGKCHGRAPLSERCRSAHSTAGSERGLGGVSHSRQSSKSDVKSITHAHSQICSFSHQHSAPATWRSHRAILWTPKTTTPIFSKKIGRLRFVNLVVKERFETASLQMPTAP